jgi:hypothetical protein
MTPEKTKRNRKNGVKETRYPLKNIPEDVYKILWREQAKLKGNRGLRQFSLSSTIYHIIREYDRSKQGQKNI